MDEVGAEFRRRIEIREQAKRLALESDSRQAVQRALRTSSTPTRMWSQGQWVYVYRRGRPGDPLHPVSRWVGPGLVVLQTKSIVWVAMRTRLWRCTPEQLRAADPSETLGRQLASDPALGELLRQVTAGTQARAVDVAREGPPSSDLEENQAPIQRASEGPDIAESTQRPRTPHSKHLTRFLKYLQDYYRPLVWNLLHMPYDQDDDQVSQALHLWNCLGKVTLLLAPGPRFRSRLRSPKRPLDFSLSPKSQRD